MGGGYSYQCLSLIDQTARCWGKNDYYQLGTPTYVIEQTQAKKVLQEN